MLLKSQTTRETMDNTAEKASVTNGIIEKIGGEVCPREGTAVLAIAEDELCAMVDKTRPVDRIAREQSR
jgi:hypothetical protein